MKSTLVIFAILLVSVLAQAKPKVVTEVTCSSNEDIWDEGYMVEVKSDNSAVLSVIDPGGKRTIRSYSVSEKLSAETQTYKAKDFTLVISIEEKVAAFKATDDLDLPLNLNLFCEFN